MYSAKRECLYLLMKYAGCTVDVCAYVCACVCAYVCFACTRSRLLSFTLAAVYLSDAKGGTYFFVVVEMMFHTFDFLIRFVSFSCHEDDIACLCQSCSSADGFAAVGDGECFGTCGFI